MPVTMPGSAIGSTIMRLSASRPKNAKRWIASDASVPSTTASTVAASPTCTLVHNASRAPVLRAASDHHWNVKPLGGNDSDVAVLNDSTTTITSGRYRNTSTSAAPDGEQGPDAARHAHQRFSSAPVRRMPVR